MRAAIQRLSRALAIVGAGLVLLTMLLISADVIMRTVTGGAVRGALEYTEIMMVGFLFLALAWAQASGAQINVVVILELLPERLASTARAVGLLVVLFLLAMMIWKTGESAWRSFMAAEFRYGIAQVAVWPARVAITIGLFAWLLQLLPEFWDEVRGAAGRAEMPPRPNLPGP